MDYDYSLPTVSLVLKVIEYLNHHSELPLAFVTVIHCRVCWFLRIKMTDLLSSQQNGNIRALLQELGTPYDPPPPIEMVLEHLALGIPITEAMNQQAMLVISHGDPDISALHTFRAKVIRGLGYCPPNLG